MKKQPGFTPAAPGVVQHRIFILPLNFYAPHLLNLFQPTHFSTSIHQFGCFSHHISIFDGQVTNYSQVLTEVMVGGA